MVINEKGVESNEWKRNITDINKKTLGLLEDNIDIMSNVIHSQSFTWNHFNSGMMCLILDTGE